MREVSIIEAFFVLGAVWRSKSILSYAALLSCAFLGEGIVTSLEEKDYHIGFTHLVALFCGLVFSSSANLLSLHSGREMKIARSPAVIVPFALIAGDFILPTGVEGSFILLIIFGSLLAIYMMFLERWDPILVHLSSGLLLMGSILNFIFRDSQHCDGVKLWWWPEAHDHSDPGYLDCINPLIEATVVIACCLLGGLISSPLILSGYLWLDRQQEIYAQSQLDEKDSSKKGPNLLNRNFGKNTLASTPSFLSPHSSSSSSSSQSASARLTASPRFGKKTTSSQLLSTHSAFAASVISANAMEELNLGSPSQQQTQQSLSSSLMLVGGNNSLPDEMPPKPKTQITLAGILSAINVKVDEKEDKKK